VPEDYIVGKAVMLYVETIRRVRRGESSGGAG